MRAMGGLNMQLKSAARKSGYWVYRHTIPRYWFRLREARIYSDALDPDLVGVFSALVGGRQPVFLGRIGGSDYALVNEYFNDQRAFLRRSAYEHAVARLRELNGYFDFERDPARFERFLIDMVAYYRAADCLTYGGAGLITKFQYNVFQRRDMKLLDYVCRGKTIINYTFLESVMPFLCSFKTWGQGKRVLVISPFSKSLEFQFSRRNDLIVDYEFPEFELVTYTSSVTYSTDHDTKESLKVTTNNWHEECRRMADDIAGLDFDIALLSCASYSMYLGDFIRRCLGRTAIYTGGILNVLFNIYGERYDTPFFNGFMRRDTQITAFEDDDISSLQGGRSRPGESLRGYFGRRPS